MFRKATGEDPAEPCLARCFHWDEDGGAIGGTIEAYRDEGKRSDIIRVRHQVQEVIYYKQAGFLATGLY